MRRLAATLTLLLAAGNAAAGAPSDPLRYCDAQPTLDAAATGRLLQVGAKVRSLLAASGSTVALVSRSGLDLSRWGQRYSHAGVGLQASPNAPWSVRQLYFACDEARPRIFDQGLAGFVMGLQDPRHGYLSIVLLPAEPAAALEAAALDERRALALLAERYSANAHAFSTRYQNCNQWLAELLASAWGGHAEGEATRERAQGWLLAQGFEPTRFELGSPLWRLLAAFVPWLHHDDHPAEDLAALRYRVSMPSSIEAFVRDQVPGAQRIEVCHDSTRVVVRRGWTPLPSPCAAAEGDEVIALD